MKVEEGSSARQDGVQAAATQEEKGMTRRQQHIGRHRLQAERAFAQHLISKTGDRRWLLQRLHEDGKPTWTFAAEVIVLEGGGLFVGGDIDFVVFAYGPADPIARIRWLGECDDLEYYVAQKARLGARESQHVLTWDSSVATEELRAFHDMLVEEEGHPLVHGDFHLDEFEQALFEENHVDFLSCAVKAFPGYPDAWESIGDMGMVLHPAVIYAHAALARLCALLRAPAATT